MTKLHIDIESRSEIDLIARGLDNYSSHPTTRILMLAWAIDDMEPELWLPHTGKPPADLRDAMRDKSVLLCAHNAQFEHTMLTRVLGAKIDRRRWRDTMIMAHYCGMPGKLGDLCEIVGMTDENAKMKDGYRLIRKFCIPRKPTKNKPWLFNDWTTDPEEWELFCTYCRFDVKAERDLMAKLAPFDLPPEEWEAWHLDQEINERGMPVDRGFVENAIGMYQRAQKRGVRYLKHATGLANPMSTPQFLPWAKDRGYPFGDMRKNNVARVLLDEVMTTEGHEALKLRAEINKASVKKFDSILSGVGDDDRLRFTFQFMGASRTGRWAGRRTQLQNLPRPAKAFEDNLEQITDLIRANDFDNLEFETGDVMLALSSTVRSSFRTPDGHKLVVADLSAIEDRMVGWLARCETILREHREGLDPYESFGTHLYKKPYEEITKTERTNSKPGRLGCCYRLSAGELAKNKNGDIIKTGLWGYAESMGVKLTQQECAAAVTAYRSAYPEVVQFWYDLEQAAKDTLKTRRQQRVGHVTFDVKPPFLRARLPSGRYLHYLRPRLEVKEFVGKSDGRPYTKEVLSYEGVDQVTKKWGKIYTHGGKLCLAEGTLVLTSAGWAPIESITPQDVVWDGQEWVSCDGHVCNGAARVINLNGVLLTPDHEVLTVGGWRAAGDCDGSIRWPSPAPDAAWVRYAAPRLRVREHHRYERVYDLVNCGPRNRFVVRDDNGEPIIVHNCENLTQAAARDVLLTGLFNARAAGFEIVGHVHDEIITVVPDGSSLTHETLEACMARNPEWCKDLPLAAAGYTGIFYKKD